MLEEACKLDTGLRIAFLDLGIVYTHNKQYLKAIELRYGAGYYRTKAGGTDAAVI